MTEHLSEHVTSVAWLNVGVLVRNVMEKWEKFRRENLAIRKRN